MKSSKILFLFLIVIQSKYISCLDVLESHSPESPENEAIQPGKRLGRISSLLKKIPKKDNNTDSEQNLDPSEAKLAQGGTNAVQMRSNFWVSVPVIKNILGRTCFKDIGCFSALEYQDFRRRPLPLLPMAPELIDPIFHIFTPRNILIAYNFSYNASPDQLRTSLFDPKLITLFVTHGFRSGFEPWIEQFKDKLYKETKEFNLICVNWEKGSKVPVYHLAATNTRVVGATIAFFISSLVKTFNTSNDKFYLIGHSLGGQVVGYAGKRIDNPKVARVIGLDPSGPAFHFENASMRLHYTDGQFVDAIHTDIGLVFSEGLGIDENFGHLDFYPNGGSSQPGCKISKGILNIIHAFSSGEEISCSHSKAHKYATYIGLKAGTDTCQPIGYDCIDYETFIEGRCNDCRESKCQPMGLNLFYWKDKQPDPKTLPYRFFLNLGVNPDFCVFHYQFAFHMTQDCDEANGVLDFTMHIKTVDKTSKELRFEKILTDIQIGEIHTLLMTFEFKLKEIDWMSIGWKRFVQTLPANIPSNQSLLILDKKRVNKGNRIKIQFIEINFMSHLEISQRRSSSFVLCPKDGPEAEIRADNNSLIFIKCDSKDVLIRAYESVPETLIPLSRRIDLFSNDYEKVNSVVQKVANSNLLKKKLFG